TSARRPIGDVLMTAGFWQSRLGVVNVSLLVRQWGKRHRLTLWLCGTGDRRDLVGEVHLAVVLRGIADLLARVGEAPEAVRVAADALDDQERHPVLVGDGLGLDHSDRLLPLVPARQVGAERAVHPLDVAGLDMIDVVVPRAADPPLDDLELP